MKKVYLAARYTRREELRKYREILQSYGVEVTSHWLDESIAQTSQMGDHPEEFYVATANLDLEDVKRADTLIFFAEDPLQGTPRGGRHVEFGYAVALMQSGEWDTIARILVIGPHENVFHYVDGVFHFESFDKLLEVYKQEREELELHGV